MYREILIREFVRHVFPRDEKKGYQHLSASASVLSIHTPSNPRPTSPPPPPPFQPLPVPPLYQPPFPPPPKKTKPKERKRNLPSSLLEQPPRLIRHFLVHAALLRGIDFPLAEFLLGGVEACEGGGVLVRCIRWVGVGGEGFEGRGGKRGGGRGR